MQFRSLFSTDTNDTILPTSTITMKKQIQTTTTKTQSMSIQLHAHAYHATKPSPHFPQLSLSLFAVCFSIIYYYYIIIYQLQITHKYSILEKNMIE